MRTLLRHLKAYRLQCILAPLFKMLEALMELIVPLLMKRIIDEGIVQGNKSLVWQMGLLLVAFGLFGFLFSAVAQFFSAKAATSGSASMREELFRKIQRLSYTDLDRLGASTLINRLTSDMTQVQTGVNMALRLALRSPFVVFGAMIMAFTVQPDLALIFAVLIPLLTVVVLLLGRLTSAGFRQVQKQQDAAVLRTRENLTGVRVLRAFNRQQAETEAFEDEQQELCRRQIHTAQFTNLLNPVTYVMVNLALIVLLQSSAGKIVAVEGMTVGEAVALVNYLSQILVELIKLTNLVATISKGIAAAGRVQSILEIPDSLPEGEDELALDEDEPLLELNNVSFRYPKAREPSLKNILLRMEKGGSLGVIGGTGSGKSTLLSVIARFYDPEEGIVRYFGKDARSLKGLHGRIGIVPQKADLFAGTIAENLRWGDPNATDEELWAALGQAQAADFVRALPEGLGSTVEQNGRNFSGGQRQRLTIARALVRRPFLLMLDDSTSALDFATEAALRASLNRLPFSVSLIIASQRASAVRFCDRIAVLEDGMLAGIGNHEELMHSCPVYREIVLSQNPEEEASK